PRAVMVRNFISQRAWLKRSAALSVVLTTDDWLARLNGLLDLAIQRDGVFHLWCHSIDIEKLQLWTQLDTFLRRVAKDIDTAQRVCNRDLINLQIGSIQKNKISNPPTSKNPPQ
ncbi:MAG: hypothetical protein ACKOA0_13605, partial [Burkholderiaceae bacterium]